MSLIRWITIAALACLGVAAAYLPPQPSSRRYLSPDTLPVSSTELRLDRANAAYRTVEGALANIGFRDSINARLRSTATVGSDLHIEIRGTLPAQSDRAFRNAVAALWQHLPPASGARMFVRLDVGKRFVQPVYVLPQALNGRTCAVSLTLQWDVEWLKNPATDQPRSGLEPWLEETLGPCLYYSAFGTPGPEIEQWLRNRYFKVANAADWNAAPLAVNLREDPRRFDMVFSDMSFNAIACTSGRTARCAPAIKQGNDEGALRVNRPAAEIPGIMYRVSWPRSFPMEDHYLAGLVHEMGRQRFARFWTSPLPVDSAFQSAFGLSLASWTARWARSQVPDFPPMGPAPRVSGALFGLAFAVLALALAGVYVTRRQVG